MPKPANEPFAPHTNWPRSLTALSVCAPAACMPNASTVAMANAVAKRFMIRPFSMGGAIDWALSDLVGLQVTLFAPQQGHLRQFPARGHLRTIALQGQGVDES